MCSQLVVVPYRSLHVIFSATDQVWKSVGVKRLPNSLRLSMMSYLFAATYNAAKAANEMGVSRQFLETHLRKFDCATELGKDRIVFLRTLPPRTRRARKMSGLIARAQRQVTFHTFESLEELKRKVMQSLLYWQQDQNRRPLL